MGLKSKRKKIAVEGDIDRISSLPDAIISEILSRLQTKCAVRTSILSKRWRYAWALITDLDFETPSRCRKPLNSFIDFVDNVLRLCNSTCIRKFRLSCENYHSDVPSSRWISEAVRRDVLELSIDIYKLDLPLNFFTCKTLTVLKLWINYYPEFDVPDSIWFPCLKSMFIHLDYSTSDITEKLFRSCPILEDLSIVGILDTEEELFFDISAPALRRLKIDLNVYSLHKNEHVILINAPKLEYFDFSQWILADIIMGENLSSLVEASVSFAGLNDYEDDEVPEPNQVERALKLLAKLGSVKSLSLDSRLAHVSSLIPLNSFVFCFVCSFTWQVKRKKERKCRVELIRNN